MARACTSALFDYSACNRSRIVTAKEYRSGSRGRYDRVGVYEPSRLDRFCRWYSGGTPLSWNSGVLTMPVTRDRYVSNDRGHPVALMAPRREPFVRGILFCLSYALYDRLCSLSPSLPSFRGSAFWEIPVRDCVSMSATLQAIRCVPIFLSFVVPSSSLSPFFFFLYARWNCCVKLKKKKKKKSKMKIQKEGIYLLTPRLHLWQFTSAVTFQDWSSHNSTFHRIWFFFLCHPTISRLFTRLLVAMHAFFSNIQRKDSWDIDGSSGTSSSAHRFWSAPVVTKSSPYLVLV